MSHSKNLLCILAILVGFAGECFATEGAGGKAGAFLRLGVGARAMAMGNAYTGVTEEASAVYWNPAGLGFLQRRQFLGMYSALSLERQHSFLAYAQPLTHRFTIGAGWIHFGISDIDGRDLSGNPTNKFDDSENAFLLAAGYKVGLLSFGATAKYLHHSLANNSASGVSFDAGVHIRPMNLFSLGFVAQDLGGKMSWNTASEAEDELPLTLRGGVAINPGIFPATISGEVVKISDEDLRVHVGAEYRMLKALGLRAGYNDSQLAFGGFIHIPTSVLNVQLDYAYGNEVLEEGAAHRVGMLLEF